MADHKAKDKAQRPEWQEWVERGATVYFGACRRLASSISRFRRKRKKRENR